MITTTPQLKSIVFTGTEIDGRMASIENIVANHFNVHVNTLDDFCKDTPAKFMCCFLVHDLLRYTVKSIAVKYGCNTMFLQNKIDEYYLKSLQDKGFMQQVTLLREAFFNNNTSRDGGN